jgi:2-polyprenyl-3-methyl-5-hydroxy-6-metoxy-1,4-benzoquinol methylase
VRIIQEEFRPGLVELTNQSFDGIYSVSVLEHISEPFLETLFKAVSRHLRPGGWSFHSVDCVIQGAHTTYHCDQCSRILAYQNAIAESKAVSEQALIELINRAHDDTETYYLSAAGHNLWRGGLSYDEFPFRKVISLQFAAQAAAG